ncbi:GAF domain-containing protein [Saccharicrinis aurantiacus]|uniref:GAF domain-containing protein n=1 Tax=Saccharicrinis aurantiacus TaxID=1849719 RepID=UPI00094F88EC|nr:GAF domain-containing protein [Saccharicrinis aurantiacus]
MKRNHKLLYLIATLAFIFTLCKYVFTQFEVSGSFIIFEGFSYVFFLLIIFISDRSLSESRNGILKLNEKIIQKDKESQRKIEDLESQLKEFTEDGKEKADDSSISSLKGAILNLDDASTLLSELSKFFEIGLAICYIKKQPSEEFVVEGHYGLSDEVEIENFIQGDGFNGQAVVDKKPLVITDIDSEYFNIESCSGAEKPCNLYLLPLVKNGETIALFELASFADIQIQHYWEEINNVIIESKLIN